jgi:hypothetical protein
MVTGFPRSGTTLLYCMLRYAVDGYEFLLREVPELRQGFITKSPTAVFSIAPAHGSHCIVMLRDPRALLTSQHEGEKFREQGYFISAHSHLSSSSKGVCEWWEAIKKLVGALIIRYEELLEDPRRIQQVIAERFGLRYRDMRYFEDFHKESHGEVFETAMNGLRPLMRRTRLNERRIDEQFRTYPELYRVCEEMGYAAA